MKKGVVALLTKEDIEEISAITLRKVLIAKMSGNKPDNFADTLGEEILVELKLNAQIE